MVEWLALIGPASIGPVSSCTSPKDCHSLKPCSVCQGVTDPIAKGHIFKYLINGAPCSPISNHWCYLIAVTDAFICLLAILQFCHLRKIWKSFKDVMPPLKEEHRINVQKRKAQKAWKKRERASKRQKKASKRQLKEQRQRSQRRARQDFEYPRRPEKVAFHRPYAEDKNAIMMRDMRSQGQQHPKHRQQFYPEQYDTRRRPNAETRTKSAKTRPTGSTRSKPSKKSNSTKHQVWYGQPVQDPVHSTGGQQRPPPLFIHSEAPSTTHHRQPPNNLVQGRNDARNIPGTTVVARPPPYTEQDINLDHFSPQPPPRTRQNPRYDNTADHRGAAPPPRTTRHREQDFATGIGHHGATSQPQTRPYLHHNMNVDQYAATLPPRTASHPQHNAMIDYHTTAPPPRMAPYPELSDIPDPRGPAPPPSSRHRSPPVHPVAPPPIPSTQPPSTGASSRRGRPRVEQARMPKIPRVRSREGPSHPVPHERALREPSPCSTESGSSVHPPMEVSPMTSQEDLRSLIARARESYEPSLSSLGAVAGSTGNHTPVVSRATSHEDLGRLMPHERVLNEPSPRSTNTDSMIADPTEHPPIPVITVTDFDLHHNDSLQHRGDRDSVWSRDSLASSNFRAGQIDAGRTTQTDINGPSERLSDRASLRSVEIHDGFVPSPVLDGNSGHDGTPEQQTAEDDNVMHTSDADHLELRTGRPDSRDSGIEDCWSDQDRNSGIGGHSTEEEKK